MKRKNVGITCLWETRWKDNKVREVGNSSYKLWYYGLDDIQNGNDVIVKPMLKDKVVGVNEKGTRLSRFGLCWDMIYLNVMSAYAPQVGLDGATKDKFWEEMDELMNIRLSINFY